jgi:hypothetical protein
MTTIESTSVHRIWVGITSLKVELDQCRSVQAPTMATREHSTRCLDGKGQAFWGTDVNDDSARQFAFMENEQSIRAGSVGISCDAESTINIKLRSRPTSQHRCVTFKCRFERHSQSYASFRRGVGERTLSDAVGFSAVPAFHFVAV